MIRKFTAVLLLFSLFALELVAQTSNSDCKNLIITYYQELEKTIKSNPNKAYHIEMSYTSWFNDKRQQGVMMDKTTISKVELTCLKSRSHNQNEQMELYKDEMDMFVILKSEKVIIRNEISDEQQNLQNNLFSLVKDSLIIASKVVSFVKGPKDFEPDVLKIDFVLSDKYKRLLKAERFNLYFDTKQSKLLAIEITYLPNQQLSKQVISYTKQEFRSAGLLNKPIKYNILDEKGYLLPKYKSFKYIDNRSSN